MTQGATTTLGHILPRAPSRGWAAFPDQDVPAYCDRLGNLALLDAAANRDLGAASFSEKAGADANSAFALTAAIGREEPDWTPAAIERRQSRMARAAAQVWRISQLDR